VIYQHWNVLNGTAIPAGSAACPGCYVSGDLKSAVFLQTLFAF